MNKDSLKLEGRVISVNAADQSFLIESKIGHHKNRRYVFANDTIFRNLNRTIDASHFHSGKGMGMEGIFYIQGKVLMDFALDKKMSVFDFIKMLTLTVDRRPSK
jgi:hypothetical protein